MGAIVPAPTSRSYDCVTMQPNFAQWFWSERINSWKYMAAGTLHAQARWSEEERAQGPSGSVPTFTVFSSVFPAVIVTVYERFFESESTMRSS